VRLPSLPVQLGNTFKVSFSVYVTWSLTSVISRWQQCTVVSPLVLLRKMHCTPYGNHAKRGMNEKTIQCLPNPSQHVPIYLQQFPSYSNRKCKKLPFSRTATHIFVSPGDAPAIITQCVAWMERQLNVCQTPRSMYPSICNNFPFIRTASAKNRRFHVPQPTF